MERGEWWSLPSTTEIAVDVAVAVAGICEVVVVTVITVVVAMRVAVDLGRVVVTVTVYEAVSSQYYALRNISFNFLDVWRKQRAVFSSEDMIRESRNGTGAP